MTISWSTQSISRWRTKALQRRQTTSRNKVYLSVRICRKTIRWNVFCYRSYLHGEILEWKMVLSLNTIASCEKSDFSKRCPTSRFTTARKLWVFVLLRKVDDWWSEMKDRTLRRLLLATRPTYQMFLYQIGSFFLQIQNIFSRKVESFTARTSALSGKTCICSSSH